MRDHVLQLLVGPHVGGQGRDIQIPHQHSFRLRVASVAKPAGELLEELELVGELVVDRGVGDIPAGGDIEVVQFHPADHRRDVAGVPPLAPVASAGLLQGQLRQDGHPVVALHAPHRLMGIAQPRNRPGGKQFVGHFGFLEANDIRSRIVHESFQEIEPQAHRIYVPGRNFHLISAIYSTVVIKKSRIKKNICG